MKESRRLYRIKFQEPDAKEPTTVTVESFSPGEYFGLVTLEGFVFNDQTKFVVLPEEDAVRKRFNKTDKLHLPYHVLLSVEEYFDDPPDLKKLPFIKEVPNDEVSPDES